MNPHPPARPSVVFPRLALPMLLTLALGTANLLQGQDSASVATSVVDATRTDITRRIADAERTAIAPGTSAELRRAKEEEARQLRARLQEGDFHVGDRIVLKIEGEPMPSDTFTVRSGVKVLLQGLDEIPLRGVLRSELRSYMAAQVSRFRKNAAVQATALVRLAVGGAVAKPGYYSLPADVLISDVIMAAGGPTQDANPDKTIVRRDSKELIASKVVRQAITSGQTLDQLNLRAGDEIVVGEKTSRSWQNKAQIVSVLSGAALLVLYATRR
ncbi:MAG: SLBB domain-containing protein [Gemmatimonadota bacterium]|nr:SLBB domain-containing protein [Gemmatimonadota bacterium]